MHQMADDPSHSPLTEASRFGEPFLSMRIYVLKCKTYNCIRAAHAFTKKIS